MTRLGAPLAAAMLLASVAEAAAQQPAPRFPPVTIPNTEVRSLHGDATGRDYDLYVYLPDGYARDSSARYPVLYLLDAQWDFKLLTSIQGSLFYDRFIPAAIIVGITWSGPRANYDSLRALDLTPGAVAGPPGSGAAPRFLAFLRGQLIPFVEGNYRADPSRRALMGSSLGGLFALYALFNDTGLFGGYVADSPALTWGNDAGFAMETAFAETGQPLPARLYLAVGGEEPLRRPVSRFMQIVAARGYRDLVMETRIIEGERHSGNKTEAFNRGLRFVFGAR